MTHFRIHPAIALLALSSIAACVSKSEASSNKPGSPSTAASNEAAAVVTTATVERVERSCNAICAHSHELSCEHPERCMPNCVAMVVGTPCSEQFSAFYQCLSGQPRDQWECDEQGVAAIKSGLCTTEQAHAVECMEAKM